MESDDTPQEKRKRGRPEGSLGKLVREARAKAMASGDLPHEILLSMARGEIQTEQYFDEASGEILTRLRAMDLEGRRDAAKAAAPYYAPKMSTVELLKTGTDDELDAIIKELAAAAGFGIGTSGESQANASTADAGAVTSEATGRRRRTFDAD